MKQITEAEYIDYLNGIGDTIGLEEYQPKAKRLINAGKFGQALKKYDPIAFNVGFLLLSPLLVESKQEERDKRKVMA